MTVVNYLFQWRKWGIKKGDLVLELGSGGSPMVRSNVLLDKYIYDDSEREMNIRQDRPLICADISNLPFKGKSFDFVYACHVLEHVDEVGKAIGEIARVGKRGLIITPGEIFERAWDKLSHRWIISVIENQLVLREKCTCTKLVKNEALDAWKLIFWEKYVKNRDLLDIHFYWENNIPFQVIKCGQTVSILEKRSITKKKARKEIKLQFMIKGKMQAFLGRLIRLLYA